MTERASLVQAYFEAWAARDFEALAAMYAPDAECIRADGESRGVEAIIDYLREIAVAFPDEAATIEAVLVSGDAVTVHGLRAPPIPGRALPTGSV